MLSNFFKHSLLKLCDLHITFLEFPENSSDLVLEGAQGALHDAALLQDNLRAFVPFRSVVGQNFARTAK